LFPQIPVKVRDRLVWCRIALDRLRGMLSQCNLIKGEKNILDWSLGTIGCLRSKNPSGWSEERTSKMPDNKQGSGRGFGSMDEDKQREIAREGGKASGGNFANDPERAAEAGRKGGQQSAEERVGGQQGSGGGRGSDQDSRGGRGGSEGGRGQQQAESGGNQQQGSGPGGSQKESDREGGSQSGRRGGGS
jgi:uncharacterized protein